MISLWNTKPQHDVSAATRKLYNILKPADVINVDGYDPLLKPWVSIPHWGIRKYQKELFGKDSNYRDTHTMAYFGPSKIFSVTTPRARWETIEQIATARFTVLRYTKHIFNDSDLDIMLGTANSIIGTKYDYGQLLDIALSSILGYDHIIKYKWFDLGKRRMVCSVGVRVLYEALRYQLLANSGIDPDIPIGTHIRSSGNTEFLYANKNAMAARMPMYRLFNHLNPLYWGQDEIKNFTRTDVEATAPVYFSSSEYFSGEFRTVLSWKDFL